MLLRHTQLLIAKILMEMNSYSTHIIFINNNENNDDDDDEDNNQFEERKIRIFAACFW